MQEMSVIRLLSVLSDPTRLSALTLLWDGREYCVCELMHILSTSQSRMSRHMSLLKNEGFVVDRRDAQWVRYRRRDDLQPQLIAIIEAVLDALRTDQKAAA